MKHLLLFLFSLINYVSIAQNKKQTTVAISWKTYTDYAKTFSLKYPSNWTIRIADSSEKAKVFVRSPKEGDNDPFIENLNVMIKKLEIQEVPIVYLQQALKNTFEKDLKNYTLIKEMIIQLNGGDAYCIEYSTTKIIDNVEVLIYVMQEVFTKNYFLYTLTYTAAKVPPNDFYNYVIAIIKSFTVIE